MRFCVLNIENALERSTVKKVKTLIQETRPGVEAIFLNSPGGTLAAGIELGRLFRGERLRTTVPEGAECHSACAYAFLGGMDREVREGADIGFHKFSLPDGLSTVADANSMLSQAQTLSSKLLSYVIAMGVDARLFVEASGTPSDALYIPSPTERIEYAIETPGKFGEFFLDPYSNGVVAASERDRPPSRFDTLKQTTFYCRNGQISCF